MINTVWLVVDGLIFDNLLVSNNYVDEQLMHLKQSGHFQKSNPSVGAIKLWKTH